MGNPVFLDRILKDVVPGDTVFGAKDMLTGSEGESLDIFFHKISNIEIERLEHEEFSIARVLPILDARSFYHEAEALYKKCSKILHCVSPGENHLEQMISIVTETKEGFTMKVYRGVPSTDMERIYEVMPDTYDQIEDHMTIQINRLNMQYLVNLSTGFA